jgi:hypothetical protein
LRCFEIQVASIKNGESLVSLSKVLKIKNKKNEEVKQCKVLNKDDWE